MFFGCTAIFRNVIFSYMVFFIFLNRNTCFNNTSISPLPLIYTSCASCSGIKLIQLSDNFIIVLFEQ